ncbi:PTS system N-acetylglucosamine-specific IIA component (Glc family) [Rathayibacter sp. PhB151]|uniref:PTS sugar transporter subunit IIA n=1 Tax=Rathayibacter sp. PhB151 TaxID=2485189 RepID=UPI0010643725|nr:PTS glucose transporter subunit IIA [Rathayibacter sp. PhB151]TDX76673.1 PTS system N-acetylglucosamine-specific IIA component (Glc family) [Rathayibacter sp. PhB151]
MVVVLSPLAGRAVPLSAVPDQLFAAGVMGAGMAIEPPAERVEVLSPVHGVLLQVLPHAFVVVADSGRAVLVHLGIDTVGLKGAGFTVLAAKGDRVEAGTPVLEYDVPAALAAGLPTVVPVVVLERTADHVDALAEDGASVLAGDPLLST